MMKFLAVGLLALPALASAQMAPAPSMPASMPAQTSGAVGAASGADQKPNTPLDPAAFCYFEGKAYSKGAEHAGQTCSSGLVSYNATPGRPASPLMWNPSRKR